MASIAPCQFYMDHARTLLADMERLSRQCVAKGIPLDVLGLALLLERGLQGLPPGDETLFFLAAYLSRCLTGSVPDYREWNPPLH